MGVSNGNKNQLLPLETHTSDFFIVFIFSFLNLTTYMYM